MNGFCRKPENNNNEMMKKRWMLMCSLTFIRTQWNIWFRFVQNRFHSKHNNTANRFSTQVLSTKYRWYCNVLFNDNLWSGFWSSSSQFIRNRPLVLFLLLFLLFSSFASLSFAFSLSVHGARASSLSLSLLRGWDSEKHIINSCKLCSTLTMWL